MRAADRPGRNPLRAQCRAGCEHAALRKRCDAPQCARTARK